MGAPPIVTPDYYQILVVRELRKAGFDVGDARVHRRSELPEPQEGFVVELLVPLGLATWRKRALVACRREEGTVAQDVVDSLGARLAEAGAEVGIVFSTSSFGGDALGAAQANGIALLHVADSRSAYDASGWNTPGHYPAWLPAHQAQVVDCDAGGLARMRPLAAGSAKVIVDRLGRNE